MKTYLSLWIVSLLFTACVLSDVESDAQQIIEDIENVIEQSTMYEVRFVFDWNSVDFPNDYPSSAHFSQLVGWVHEKNHSYFKEGGTCLQRHRANGRNRQHDNFGKRIGSPD